MTEGYEDNNAEFISEDIPAVINGVTYNADVKEQFRDTLFSAYSLISENNTLSDKIETSQIPQDKLFFEMSGLKMYEIDNVERGFAVMDKTTNANELKNLQERAIQEFKNHYGNF
jgi:hypothetical protein